MLAYENNFKLDNTNGWIGRWKVLPIEKILKIKKEWCNNTASTIG
jgi:hypothetical protein